MLSDKDIKTLKDKKLSSEQVLLDIERLKNGKNYAKIKIAAVKNNGIVEIPKNKEEKYIEVYNNHIQEKSILKFVPASGAASRMFKDLIPILIDDKDYWKENISESARKFFKDISKFAFYDDLKNILLENNHNLEKLIIKKDYKTILQYLLTDEGLNYKDLPKALIAFHKTEESNKTAIERHLEEAVDYATQDNNQINIHFTILDVHYSNVKDFVDNVKFHYENKHNVEYNISYSIQHPSTNKVAINDKDEIHRCDKNEIVLRPGGHGALLNNLNELDADIIFIKNIDNVSPDKNRFKTQFYKKLLGGYLFSVQEKIFDSIRFLKSKDAKEITDKEINEIDDFIKNKLHIIHPKHFDNFTKEKKINYLIEKLDRPLRVCGMVPNEGDAGGGPFWTENKDGSISLHIVESAEINQDCEVNKKLIKQVTHFNPCDIVCSFVDYEGNLFDIGDYADHDAYFVTEKNDNGTPIKAIELPGLWNGTMSNWNTIFVEIPGSTFSPVKSINDLLSDDHQH